MSTITLRAATIDDATHIAEVLLSSRTTFVPYAPIAHPDADVRRWVRQVLIPSGGVTAACAGDSVVGVLATVRESGVSWINQLYIARGHTGQGIGTRLLNHALVSLDRPVRLYTFQANTRARSFYEQHGFKAIAFGDGSANEERCPDVLYELASTVDHGA
ncbi:MAG: GNAT family N-acetyltransferase [Proteobacteria bacterium]|jgi:ribosomal protein S18 acetylase RimI-like enzyme|nr:GNAT family N-acetyltransferase [Pseudomonadota bacterium]